MRYILGTVRCELPTMKMTKLPLRVLLALRNPALRRQKHHASNARIVNINHSSQSRAYEILPLFADFSPSSLSLSVGRFFLFGAFAAALAAACVSLPRVASCGA